ncbi:hypothetical protein APHAL10511_007931 [Amanita phalloides]|nr:hypothetical protein APHAL10511_007931 [Amanita phalloides]
MSCNPSNSIGLIPPHAPSSKEYRRCCDPKKETLAGCYKAGPSHRSFYAPSPQAISQNLNKLYESLKNEPFPVRSRQAGSYGIVDHNFLRTVVFVTLYTPYSQFPALAEGLTALSKGDAETFWDIAIASPEVDASYVSEAAIAIQCNDGDSIPGMDWPFWWPNLGKYFRGPFVANTSHPILLIGKTADPVSGAKKMSKGFPGSVVLTQDSAGHCSFTAPSTCTVKHVKAYFETGVLPAEGTVCPVLAPPIPAIPNGLIPPIKRGISSEESDLESKDDEDRPLVDAVWGRSKLQLLRKRF